YITDVGMTGVQGSSIGMRYEDVFHRLVAKLPRRYRPAEGPATVCALAVDLEGTRATRVERLWVPQERRAAVEGAAGATKGASAGPRPRPTRARATPAGGPWPRPRRRPRATPPSVSGRRPPASPPRGSSGSGPTSTSSPPAW